MFTKILFLLLAGTATAAALLGLRQQRYVISGQMVAIHQQTDRTRRDLWDLQNQANNLVDPRTLWQTMQSVQQTMTPLVDNPIKPDLPKPPKPRRR